MRTNKDIMRTNADTDAYKDLEGKYLNGLENMTVEEIGSFLEFLQANRHFEFAERRIPILLNKLNAIKKMENVASFWEKEWKTAAYEYVDITNRWLEFGATWKCKETVTKWTYEGEVFYTWFSGFSGRLITEEIHHTRKADELFDCIRMSDSEQ